MELSTGNNAKKNKSNGHEIPMAARHAVMVKGESVYKGGAIVKIVRLNFGPSELPDEWENVAIWSGRQLSLTILLTHNSILSDLGLGAYKLSTFGGDN